MGNKAPSITDWNFSFAAIPHAAVWDKSLSDKAYRLYSLLIARAGGGIESHPSMARIADDLDISVRQVQRLVGELSDRGLVLVEQRVSKSNVYQIVDPNKCYGTVATKGFPTFAMIIKSLRAIGRIVPKKIRSKRTLGSIQPEEVVTSGNAGVNPDTGVVEGGDTHVTTPPDTHVTQKKKKLEEEELNNIPCSQNTGRSPMEAFLRSQLTSTGGGSSNTFGGSRTSREKNTFGGSYEPPERGEGEKRREVRKESDRRKRYKDLQDALVIHDRWKHLMMKDGYPISEMSPRDRSCWLSLRNKLGSVPRCLSLLDGVIPDWERLRSRYGISGDPGPGIFTTQYVNQFLILVEGRSQVSAVKDYSGME